MDFAPRRAARMLRRKRNPMARWVVSPSTWPLDMVTAVTGAQAALRGAAGRGRCA